MPSSTKILIKALQYILDHEPLDKLESSSLSHIAPPHIFQKLYPTYISGIVSTTMGQGFSIMDAAVTCEGLEYLDLLLSRTAMKRIIRFLERVLFTVIGILATLAFQLIVTEYIKP